MFYTHAFLVQSILTWTSSETRQPCALLQALPSASAKDDAKDAERAEKEKKAAAERKKKREERLAAQTAEHLAILADLEARDVEREARLVEARRDDEAYLVPTYKNIAELEALLKVPQPYAGASRAIATMEKNLAEMTTQYHALHRTVVKSVPPASKARKTESQESLEERTQGSQANDNGDNTDAAAQDAGNGEDEDAEADIQAASRVVAQRVTRRKTRGSNRSQSADNHVSESPEVNSSIDEAYEPRINVRRAQPSDTVC